MNPRFFKELRLLAWPWVVGALASALLPLLQSALVPEVVPLVFLVLGGSVVFMSALPFGAEFQQNTLPLLLSQPCGRARLWAEKMGALTFAALMLGVVHYGPLLLAQSGLGPLLAAVFLCACICAVGFWVSVTWSLVRGTLLGLVSQGLVFLALGVAVRMYGPGTLRNAPIPSIVLCAILYCAGLAWLGRDFWRRWPLPLLGALGAALLLWRVFSYTLLPAAGAETSGAEAPLEALFLLATLCSTGYWTLVARSTVGGLALSVGAQSVVAALTAFFAARFSLMDGPKLVVLAVGVTLAYSALCLGLGGWKFANFELRGGPAGDSGALAASADSEPRWWSAWLVCRRQGAWANLLRKELRLLRPVFLIAFGYTLWWGLMFVLLRLKPQEDLEGLVRFTTCFFIPLECLLAGCISLGEEKAMGLAVGNLILPAAPGRQWLAKLTVSLATALALGLVLPFFLTKLGAFMGAPPRGVMTGDGGFWQTFAALGVAMFLMGFWASTLEASTVRAALAAVLGLGLVVGCSVLAAYSAQQFSGLERAWLVPAIEDPRFLYLLTTRRIIHFAVVFLFAAVSCLVLIQSYYQFRRASGSGLYLLRQFLLLEAGTALIGFWCADLMISATYAQ